MLNKKTRYKFFRGKRKVVKVLFTEKSSLFSLIEKYYKSIVSEIKFYLLIKKMNVIYII
jgi:hypothetical protein